MWKGVSSEFQQKNHSLALTIVFMIGCIPLSLPEKPVAYRGFHTKYWHTHASWIWRNCFTQCLFYATWNHVWGSTAGWKLFQGLCVYDSCICFTERWSWQWSPCKRRVRARERIWATTPCPINQSVVNLDVKLKKTLKRSF